MEWKQIAISLATLIISSVISFVIALFTSKRQKELEFGYDYRKYILNKRKRAYNKVESYIAALDPNKFVNKFIPIAKDTEKVKVEVNNYKILLQAVNEIEIWISATSYNKIWAIITAFDNIKALSEYNAESIKAFSQSTMNIIHLHKELVEIYFDDIICLDKIEDFKKDQLEENKKKTQIIAKLIERLKE